MRFVSESEQILGVRTRILSSPRCGELAQASLGAFFVRWRYFFSPQALSVARELFLRARLGSRNNNRDWTARAIMPNATITTTCCIVGGGPAGMMLGFLLARAGVKVVVLEKHADFFRDFRGDTVHPSTLELMVELGFIDEFLKLPHQKVETVTAQVGAEHLQMVDFRHLPTR